VLALQMLGDHALVNASSSLVLLFFFSFLPQCKYPFCTALQVYTLLLWGGLQIYELDAGSGFPEQFHQQQVLTIKSVLRVFCLTFLKEQ
jgi:hypothetical protein